MAPNAESVAVAGAGIGGLAAALALSRAGYSVELYERRPELSEAGAGIQLGPNATHILASLGVLDALRAVAAVPDGLSIHDGACGREIARFPLGSWLGERHGAPYLTLHRQDLHRALLDAATVAQGVSLHRGREVVGYSNTASGVVVTIADGAESHHAALIAADGLWSKFRSRVSGSEALSPLGKCAYRAVAKRDALPRDLRGNDVHIWLADNAHAVHYPVRGGDEIAMVVVIDGHAGGESWATEASVEALAASSAGGLAAPLRELLFSVSEWRMWPLQKLPPLSRWTDGAVALLGDAAHPIAPFFAQGGVLAIEDAAVLAKVLSNGDSVTVTERLAMYARQRKPRADRVVAASTRNGDIYHARGLVAAARNAVLGTMPGTQMMRRYDWLYGWKPD